MKIIFATVLGIVLLAGCSIFEHKLVYEEGNGKPNPVHHVISISSGGNLLNPINRQPINDSPSPKAKKEEAGIREQNKITEEIYVKNILTRFHDIKRQQPNLELTIFIHGGLNTFTTAGLKSLKFSEDMIKDNQYPLFIGWNSGGPTNYVDHIWKIRRGTSAPLMGPATSPLVFLGDVARSIIRFPASATREISNPFTVMKTFDSIDEEDFYQRMDLLKTSGINISNEPPYTGVGGSYWTVLNPVKLITAPFIDGLGSGSWESMVRRTELILSKSDAFEGSVPKTQNYADTAATRFLKEWENDESLKNVKVNMIGHSMGAIVATHILARHPDFNFQNIIFMGGAAQIKDVEDVVVPWMQNSKHGSAKFYNLSLDPYREMSENRAYDFLPRGSLLNWIDNVFGGVNSFKNLTVGSWWNVIRAAQDVFPAGKGKTASPIRPRIYLTRFPIGNEKEYGPQEHGQFDEYCFWKESFWLAEKPALIPFPECMQARQ